MKKIITLIVTIFLLFSLSGCKNNNQNAGLSIISTNYPGYDFARAITKDMDDINVEMLLKPGSEMHDYEPTPQDIIKIKNSDLFIYVGGDSDEWISDILQNIDLSKTKVIKLMDLVDLEVEELIEGMEDEGDDAEYDEHVWTSPINAITIINKLKDEIVRIDESNKINYENNANDYVSQLNDIDKKIRSVIASAKRKELIFGDRFPLRYFTDEYNLTYYAAFKGCSDATEASSKTISFLINKVKSDNIPVVFHIEQSNGNIANTIARETGVKVLEFASAHNISQTDFDAGITYVDIMNKNIEVLKEALN